MLEEVVRLKRSALFSEEIPTSKPLFELRESHWELDPPCPLQDILEDVEQLSLRTTRSRYNDRFANEFSLPRYDDQRKLKPPCPLKDILKDIELPSFRDTRIYAQSAITTPVRRPSLSLVSNKDSNHNYVAENESIKARLQSALQKKEGKEEAPTHLRIFICHSSQNKSVARLLYNWLRSRGFLLWMDERDILPGQNWHLEVRKAIRSSHVIIILLSQSMITRAGFVQKEIRYALDVADEQPEGTVFLIPIRLDDCEVPERLREHHWINFDNEQMFERLERALCLRAGTLGVTSNFLEYGQPTETQA